MNNTDELRTKFGDVKEDFLANYRFNLCPENSLGEGYITEKIFESIASGCIPIYWGDYLEPGILNPKAILRYKVGEEAELYEQVKELWEDEDAHRRFVEEPPFVEGGCGAYLGIYTRLTRASGEAPLRISTLSDTVLTLAVCDAESTPKLLDMQAPGEEHPSPGACVIEGGSVG